VADVARSWAGGLVGGRLEARTLASERIGRRAWRGGICSTLSTEPAEWMSRALTLLIEDSTTTPCWTDRGPVAPWRTSAPSACWRRRVSNAKAGCAPTSSARPGMELPLRLRARLSGGLASGEGVNRLKSYTGGRYPGGPGTETAPFRNHVGDAARASAQVPSYCADPPGRGSCPAGSVEALSRSRCWREPGYGSPCCWRCHGGFSTTGHNRRVDRVDCALRPGSGSRRRMPIKHRVISCAGRCRQRGITGLEAGATGDNDSFAGSGTSPPGSVAIPWLRRPLAWHVEVRGRVLAGAGDAQAALGLIAVGRGRIERRGCRWESRHDQRTDCRPAGDRAPAAPCEICCVKDRGDHGARWRPGFVVCAFAAEGPAGKAVPRTRRPHEVRWNPSVSISTSSPNCRRGHRHRCQPLGTL